MSIYYKHRKKIALGLMALWFSNTMLPGICYALTSGPTQPETQAFQPAGVSDMVDLFTGDFKYNVPLLDIDGYPINLNYESGSGMDDEASWVGLGWNVNVGAINRQVRGLPDDMSGDTVETDHYTKPKVTVGGKLSVKFELKGSGISGTADLGIFNDNYTGIGAEVGANAGISFSFANGSPFTSSLGLGVTSSTADGVELSPYVSLGIKEKIDANTFASAGLSSSLGYNSRSGLKSLTLGSSFDVKEIKAHVNMGGVAGGVPDIEVGVSNAGVGGGASGSFITYNTEPISPDISVPYRSAYGSFSVDLGPVVEIAFPGGGITGYKTVREVASEHIVNPAYGFLYAERGKNQPDAVMDFTREKDNVVIPELPNLAIPVHTPDLFTYTSQLGSGQFRLYRGGSGAFFDHAGKDDNSVTSAGGDIGVGYLVHGGVTLYKQTTVNASRKWVNNNKYLPKADFQDVSYTQPGMQNAYFKVVGEKTLEDSAMIAKLHGTQTLAVSISGQTANAKFTNAGLETLVKTTRQVNQTQISYLTGNEAIKGALDTNIRVYPLYDTSAVRTGFPSKPVAIDSIRRVNNWYRKPHHISEMTVTDRSGKRMVYGLPVYNISQSDYTFAIGVAKKDYHILQGTNNLDSLLVNNPGTSGATINHTKGIDNYYHRQTQPAYASSFLLTAILSPDYVDKTGNGISDDDLGTAIKFNYAKLPKPYKWRTPFKGATINKALLADEDDDKGSIVYGEKEVWYLSSIESKTKVAYFITLPRHDALGTSDFTGQHADTTNTLRYLAEIRLYSKADMTRPIKVVKFNYNYELCRGLPNNADNIPHISTVDTLGGKLTLKSVHFEYQNSTKGANFPYKFTYNRTVNGSEINYGDMETDRWGVFKKSNENRLPLDNYEFPYTNQDIAGSDTVKQRLDQNSALWHLSSVGLPTGGTINVTYESDDYAYVQDKRAMTMSGIDALIDAHGNGIDTSSVSMLKSTAGMRVKIPNTAVSGDTTAWFKNTYLNGSDYIYTKFMIDISTPYYINPPYQQKYEMVSCYSQVRSVSVSGSGGYAKIFFELRNEGGITNNPVIFSAWQCMKNEYPRYAYPGFQTRANELDAGGAVITAVQAVVTAISNLSELTENFYQKAYRKNFACHVSVPRSFVRLVKQDGYKLGGGSRVKKIRIMDNWHTMAGNRDRDSVGYGQAYTYTTVANGVTVSSGVASYEPTVGCDENPFRQPVPYMQHIKGALDNFFDLEQPFGESFFPAPTVGYSKVTVTDLDKSGVPDPTLRTGYSVSEFYTAKDFPVQAAATPIQPVINNPPNTLSFVGGTSINEMTLSQGYSVTVNDMHGKQKASRTFNQSGSEIASTVYYYKADSLGASSMKLNNAVNIVNPNGTISNNKVIGRDVDFFTDFREYETKNSGISDNIGFDMIVAWFIIFPLPHFPEPANNEYKLFRSACAIKVNSYYGIVDHVVKSENGSVITTQNLAFDGLTGDPVVTQTQNEFNNTIYSVNMPAYWAYAGMGGAYQNSGILLQDFTTDTKGQFPSQYNSYLQPGDEIVDITSGGRYWVVRDKAITADSVTKKMVDRTGMLVAGFNAHNTETIKLVRSGFRNMLSSNTQSIVSLNNPIQSNQLVLRQNSDQTNLQVINASATAFNESWSMDQHGQLADSTAYITGIGHRYEYADTSYLRGSGGGLFMPGGFTTSSSLFWQQALNRSGIWANPHTNKRWGDTVMVDTIVTLSQDAQYVGYSGDGSCKFKVNGSSLSPRTNAVWCLQPVSYAAHTSVHIQIEAVNASPYKGGVGMEFYNNDSTQLYHASSGGAGINIAFTTYSMAYQPDTVNWAWRKHINPYVRGFLGNWREHGSLVFQQSRHYNPAGSVRGLGIKNAGYINNFSPYWYYGVSGWTTDSLGNRSRWVTANTITGYDDFGQQIENKDALGRYSAAKFDFNGELPAAVASNAMNREIYAASFEDGFFSPGTVKGYMPDVDFLKTGTDTLIKHYAIDTLSHSGNYSVPLPAVGYTLRTLVHDNALQTTNLLVIDTLGEYNLKSDTGLYPVGFQPIGGKKYIFDVWVNDHVYNDLTTRIQLTQNGTTVPLTCKALVENWKLIEGTIEVGSADTLKLVLTPTTSNVFVDDLRIHPFDSQMKTYVYDSGTMRLMAEIDENGFATFYEYDDEGLLIRVKKETERGIMTIKESRSSYKKGGASL
ncbi:MAG: hypothetical protein ACHQHN_04245 [Sphingobacteriales bacterium]